MGLQARYRIVGGYRITSGSLTAEARNGGDPDEPVGDCRFEDGTGAGQANQPFAVNFTVAAGGTESYDLKGGGGELDVLNRPLAMVAVKLVLLEIDAPAAGVSLQFGPRNVTNAAQLWFSGVGAAAYETVLERMFHCDKRAGWAVGASTKIVSIHNPGAADVTGTLRVIGVK